MYFSRRFFLLPLLCASILFREEAAAQTNVIDLCTEEALLEKIADGGVYRLECDVSIVSINLTAPLVITKDIQMIATNEVLLNGQNLTRLLIIRPGVNVTLEGFSFFSGRQTETNQNNGGIDETAGGAIYNDGGTLILRRARFENNSVVGITGSAGDEAGEDGDGGGDAAGGAIYNNGGTVTISNAVFVSNSATGGVGGKGGAGRNTGLGSDGGPGGSGGSAGGAAIYSIGGSVNVYASTFTNNIATGSAAGEGGAAGGSAFPGLPGEAGDGVGAAIATENAALTVVGSTFVTNSVRAANGLNGTAGVGRNDGSSGRKGGDAAGAAIYSTGRLSLTNSTFVRNAGTSGNGGNGGNGSASGFGYSGGEGGDGGTASGGAIESVGPGSIVHCTFSDNALTVGSGGTAGVGAGLGEDGDDGSAGALLGEAIYASGDQQVILANSIVAFSSPTIAGEISDRGGNITTDRNALITSSLSFYLSNPRLQPLANNGGPTPTMAIRTNSIAINAGVTSFCTPTDQRGTNRVGKCDIGAFEFIATLNEVVGTNGFQLISVTNGPTLLRWPAGHSNIVLQGTQDILRTNSWVTITNGITETNNFLYFTVSADSGLPYFFYRLFSPTGGGTTGGGGPPTPPALPSPGAPAAPVSTNRPPEEIAEPPAPPSVE